MSWKLPWHGLWPKARRTQESDSLALQSGETVRLQAGGDEHFGAYMASVRAVGQNRIFLDINSGQTIGAMPVRLFFSRGDALYYFDTRTTASSKRGGIAVAAPRQIVRVQRREYYRLPLEAATTFRVVNSSGRLATEPIAARIVNLSGGGALVAVPKPPLPAGAYVVLKVPSGKDGYSIPVQARSLGCDVALRGSSRAYLARLQFTESELPADDREAIVTYIHEQQRLMLRTRKLLKA